MKDRKEILLRAAYDLLTKCNRSQYVLDANSTTVFYDDAECDGYCLRDDIASELGIDISTNPLRENLTRPTMNGKGEASDG